MPMPVDTPQRPKRTAPLHRLLLIPLLALGWAVALL